ncbi:MAG: F-box-like domain-containing protein [Sulfobacillus sp.]
MHPAPPVLLDLPDEVLGQIFAFLSPNDWAMVSRTCQKFRRIAADDYWYWEPRARKKWTHVNVDAYGGNWWYLYRDNNALSRRGTCVWTIPVDELKQSTKLLSPICWIGGFAWRMYLKKSGAFIGLYARPGESSPDCIYNDCLFSCPKCLKYPWRHAKMTFVAGNCARTTSHDFVGKRPDWGFTRMCTVEDLLPSEELQILFPNELEGGRTSASAQEADVPPEVKLMIVIENVSKIYARTDTYLDPDETDRLNLLGKYVEPDKLRQEYIDLRYSKGVSQACPLKLREIVMGLPKSMSDLVRMAPELQRYCGAES